MRYAPEAAPGRSSRQPTPPACLSAQQGAARCLSGSWSCCAALIERPRIGGERGMYRQPMALVVGTLSGDDFALYDGQG